MIQFNHSVFRQAIFGLLPTVRQPFICQKQSTKLCCKIMNKMLKHSYFLVSDWKDFFAIMWYSCLFPFIAIGYVYWVRLKQRRNIHKRFLEISSAEFGHKFVKFLFSSWSKVEMLRSAHSWPWSARSSFELELENRRCSQFKLMNLVQNLQLYAFQQVQVAELIGLFFLILNGFCSSAWRGTYSQPLHTNRRQAPINVLSSKQF